MTDEKTTHYFTAHKGVRLREQDLFELKKAPLPLYSCKGVFASTSFDRGTAALLKYALIPQHARVLDLGCGCGVVGIVLMKEQSAVVDFVDVNRLAVQLTKKNLARHKLEARVLVSDLFDKVPDDYEVIISNPPYAAGRELLRRLIVESKDHLVLGGSLQLVFRYAKGGKFVEQFMEEIFGNVTVLGKQGGFRVFSSKKASTD
ncbi:MAG: class I SAM-dependent methyltransferase [Candidatus Woesearchaeota archaeon]|nr:MAG: class I SAM-dependent methyltransferase [Candidatus Woesearchaeota archaeon]